MNLPEKKNENEYVNQKLVQSKLVRKRTDEYANRNRV